jgi:hypothetical protein
MWQYLKDLISADKPDRVSAVLALLAGICLCIGFLGTIFRANRVAELAIVSAGLVSLATFAKDK